MDSDLQRALEEAPRGHHAPGAILIGQRILGGCRDVLCVLGGDARTFVIPMAYEFHYRRLVHWQDTDLAGIIHYTNYFRYMDEAETEFYRSVGLHKLADSSAEGVTCPRVSATCDFVRPAVFGDELDVHLRIAKKGRSSIVFAYSFKRGPDGEEVARGSVTCAFSARGEDGKLRSTPIPERFDRLFEVAPSA